MEVCTQAPGDGHSGTHLWLAECMPHACRADVGAPGARPQPCLTHGGGTRGPLQEARALLFPALCSESSGCRP